MLTIVPFYNCENWLERSLHSLAIQQGDTRVVMVDDTSTDRSSLIAETYARYYGWDYHRNDENMKCPYNIWWAIQNYGDQGSKEPIVILDGDDWFPHPQCLTRIHEIYEDPNIWVTYGNYIPDPPDPLCPIAAPYTHDIIVNRSYRHAGNNLFNHPLTWRTWLFEQIPTGQMQTPEGEWFRSGYDRVFMWPLLELATAHDGTYHWKCLPDILYTYNSANHLSEVRVNLDAAKESEIASFYPILEPAVRHA